MAKKSGKVTKSAFSKHNLPEVYAFSIIVLLIIIIFTVIAYITSTRPL